MLDSYWHKKWIYPPTDSSFFILLTVSLPSLLDKLGEETILFTNYMIVLLGYIVPVELLWHNYTAFHGTLLLKNVFVIDNKALITEPENIAIRPCKAGTMLACQINHISNPSWV